MCFVILNVFYNSKCVLHLWATVDSDELEDICQITRRLQRRSLRLPTRSKSAQTGHLCTTVQAGTDPGIFVCRSKFPGLKVGRRSQVLISKYGIAIEHMKQKEQYHSFSACVDAGYDIKESITDIPRDIQQTMQ